jgi:hypothetical protein
MRTNQLDDFVGLCRNGQVGIDGRMGQRGGAGFPLDHRGRERLRERIACTGIGGLSAPARPEPLQPTTVATQRAVDGAPGLA